MAALFGIVLPVHNEAECLGVVLDELQQKLPAARFSIAVGLNACTDGSAAVARQRGVFTGETDDGGYGHGCLAAIKAFPTPPTAYLFVAGDGANDPEDILHLAGEYERSASDFIIGQRTLCPRNWRPMGAARVLPNLILGLYTGLLTGRLWSDLGPLRLISRELFDAMRPQELTWGWTIEGQIMASRLGARIQSFPVTERARIGGRQKVSGVHWRQSLRIARAIASAGWRVRHRSFIPS